jgi:hypothetical protein
MRASALQHPSYRPLERPPLDDPVIFLVGFLRIEIAIAIEEIKSHADAPETHSLHRESLT